MNRRIIYLVLGLALAAFGCSQERQTAPMAPAMQDDAGNDIEALAQALIAQAGWAIESANGQAASGETTAQRLSCPVYEFERTIITDNIAHYSIRVRVGSGPFDVIGLHRVVRESRPNRPIRAPKSVFFDHGDFTSFVSAFMTSTQTPELPDGYCLPVYLAQHGIDVWGIDHGWALVPAETTNFSFMNGWGIMKDIGHLRTAIGISRVVRLLTGSGGDRVTLLGWSTGSVRTFAYANDETQRPPLQRHVKAIIPVEQYLKTDDPALVEANCASVGPYADDIQQGIYEDDTGGFIQAVVEWARTDPGGDSPIVPGMTNLQFALLFGTATYQLAFPVAPCFHLVAGVFDENGLPSGVQHMSTAALLDFLAGFSPWMPNQILVDEFAVACEQDDVPFDDHLGEITVPVLWVGAGGGYGSTMEYMMGLLGSTDLTGLVVSLDSDRCLDYAHVDLFMGDDAEALVWGPILNWVEQH